LEITCPVPEKDTDVYACDRDADVIKLAKEAGVEVIVRMGRTLCDPDELVKKNGNKPMSQAQKVASTLAEPTKPQSAPTSLPDPREVDSSSIDQKFRSRSQTLMLRTTPQAKRTPPLLVRNRRFPRLVDILLIKLPQIRHKMLYKCAFDICLPPNSNWTIYTINILNKLCSLTISNCHQHTPSHDPPTTSSNTSAPLA
jgi:hypothetical protein